MINDLVELLDNVPGNSANADLCFAASDEIERLQEENDILRNAVVLANSANRRSSMDQLALSESQDRWRDLAVKLLDQNVKNLDLLDEIDLLRNKVQDLQAYAEQDSCIVDRLRWQLMHSIYCPRQACHICSEIEKEICHG